ncbi:citramalate synthase [Bosea lathyri]|uniref:Citramalate synthase n=1 Tax=Bosea lathyri TaxID=1036778 RepID=A0A1H6BY25_9HYPH|nr:citramalate synthase [Bosea lathyri]SEG65553.1 2-isopropylmalate synthase [Bosea lathyri]
MNRDTAPSPLAGEGWGDAARDDSRAAPAKSQPGNVTAPPHPTAARPPSPARGEGKGAGLVPARVHLFDTTLRDGAQTTGVDFSLDDKRAVAGMLDRLGIDYVEGGYPGANPLDTAFFAQKPTNAAKFAAFGMTKRAGRSASNDPGIAALLEAKADVIVFVAKASDYQVRVALEISLEDNLAGIRESVEAAKAAGREVMLDCEHFFDGYKANPDYALACARAAFDAGARWVVLCDTNGGTLPQEVAAIVAEVAKTVPGDNLGIHAHDDCGCAVANSLAAVEAGVRQIQGTLNGLGERCGNANLVTLIGALKLKDRYRERFSIGVGEAQLSELTHVSRALDEMLNRAPNRHAPFVGASAFATKAGIHASAVMKDPRTYEHVAPEATGNLRKVLISDQGGKSNLVAELERIGVTLGRDDPRLTRVLDEVKEKEAQGYAFEGADASFFLLAKRIMGEVPTYFEIERFAVNVERRHNALGELVTFSEAIVKVKVGDEVLISAAEGASGPVNALDVALRKDLGRYQSLIEGLRLVDYKVRIFQGGTDAVTRVLIESADETGERWTTVGVSANIIDASFQALVDSITYKLVRAGATA